MFKMKKDLPQKSSGSPEPKPPAAPELEDPFFDQQHDISFFGFSQPGENHLDNDIPCQDRCAAQKIPNSRWVIAAIADGVGSCALSDIGAYTAVHAALDLLFHKLSQMEPAARDALEETAARALLQEAMQCALDSVSQKADELDQLLYSFQSTLTIALYNGNDLHFAHIGDDGIVAHTADGRLFQVTHRHKGTQKNALYPLQSPEHWEFGSLSNVTAFLMTTDGILDSYVKEQDGREYIYYPFAESILTFVPERPGDLKKLCREYDNYLGSKAFRQHVKDDLTLLAVTRPWTPPAEFAEKQPPKPNFLQRIFSGKSEKSSRKPDSPEKKLTASGEKKKHRQPASYEKILFAIGMSALFLTILGLLITFIVLLCSIK